MSLNTLGKAFLAVTLAVASPNLGCDRAQPTISGETTPEKKPPTPTTTIGNNEQQTNIETPIALGEQEIPECGKGIRITDGHHVSRPWGSTEENFECAWDHLNNKDCRAIREEGRAKIEKIPSLFECKEGQVKLIAQPSELADIKDFSFAIPQTRGNCDQAIADFSRRISRVLRRLTCGNKDKKPYEELRWGESEGGRIYNPCSGGHC
ncbi:MAG: hypothetical protein WC651_01350 [Candidatus Gracilibacteria bacterium]|jgi:hypothetical protein